MSTTKSFKFKQILSLLVLAGLVTFVATSVRNMRPRTSKKPLTIGHSVSELKDSLPKAQAKATLRTPFGEDGVNCFSNLYYKGSSFYLMNEGQPETQLNFLGKANYDYTVQPMDQNQFTKHSKAPSYTFSGTTLILASSQEMKNLQHHYFHFLEEFILGWAAHKGLQTSEIKTVIFPDIDRWHGVNNLNLQILQSVCPNLTVLGKSQFKELSDKHLIQFEKAIIVDRHACHNLSEVGTYNKMAIGHAKLIRPEYLKEMREHLYRHLKTYDQPNRRQTITYINRKNRRYLEKDFEKDLLNTLKKEFPDHKIQAVWFEKHTYAEQIQIIRNTDILIGAHGNGLTHSYFLPDDALVLEIFPEGAFAMDYQLISELSGHEYYAIESKDGIISYSGHHMRPRGNVNQVINEFDKSWILAPIKGHIEHQPIVASLKEMFESGQPLINE